VTAGTTCVASYLAPNGHYSVSSNYFTSNVVTDWLTAPAAGNGSYRYGGGFPTSTSGAANYWVDVVYVNGSGGGTGGPAISAVSSSSATSGGATITWTTDVASTSSVSYGTSATSLTGSASSATLVTAHSVPLSGLQSGTTYYYRVSSSVPGGGSTTSPATTQAPLTFSTTCPCALFTTSSTPSTVDAGDSNAVELGVKIVPARAGTISGIRFYKATANTGTHRGTLWSSTGTALATGTFSGESASGWQTLTFTSPVAVTAATTYIASYFAPSGHYSANGGFFSSDYTAGPLTAPGGSNGVYLYGGGFPINTFGSSNYWVDVLFS
jgi:hypothetical protein